MNRKGERTAMKLALIGGGGVRAPLFVQSALLPLFEKVVEVC